MLSWRNPVLITTFAVTTEQMELIFAGGFTGERGREEVDSLSPFVWEVAAIRQGFSTGSLLLRNCCSWVLLMSQSCFIIDDNK